MALRNFETIVEKAKNSGAKNRVVIAGADAENILLGAFQAQDAGFATPVLVGEADKILPMLERLGLKDKPYRLVETKPGDNVTQAAIAVINQGEGDILMRGNTQTRAFLLPLLDKKNGLRTNRLLTHIDLVSMPEYPKLMAIGDVTCTIEPNQNQKKMIIRNMVDTLRYVEDEKPNIALLALVEETSFHMKDTIEAYELAQEHARKPIADCELVGPIAYDLILSKEAARLKNYDCPFCGDFDGIIAPSLLAGNLIVKGWQMHAHARTCGVVVGAKIPVALTSRSDDRDVSFLSLALCTVLPKQYPDV
jgi:phosphate acetyltransferase/phosphate butyryltransferase